MIFITGIFKFPFIGEFLNLRASIQLIEIKLSKIGVFTISKNFEFARQRIHEFARQPIHKY